MDVDAQLTVREGQEDKMHRDLEEMRAKMQAEREQSGEPPPMVAVLWHAAGGQVVPPFAVIGEYVAGSQIQIAGGCVLTHCVSRLESQSARDSRPARSDPLCLISTCRPPITYSDADASPSVASRRLWDFSFHVISLCNMHAH